MKQTTSLIKILKRAHEMNCKNCKEEKECEECKKFEKLLEENKE